MQIMRVHTPSSLKMKNHLNLLKQLKMTCLNPPVIQKNSRQKRKTKQSLRMKISHHPSPSTTEHPLLMTILKKEIPSTLQMPRQLYPTRKRRSRQLMTITLRMRKRRIQTKQMKRTKQRTNLPLLTTVKHLSLKKRRSIYLMTIIPGRMKRRKRKAQKRRNLLMSTHG